MSAEIMFYGVRLAGKPRDMLWDLHCKDGCINTIKEAKAVTPKHDGRLLTPGLCHPHIHLDKCFLLSHPKYADLEIQRGDFAEAMELTSKAKARFEYDDLVERGRALIQESIAFGVTHMRAFVEVDAGVTFKCLDAGLALKQEFKDRCHIQICAFAQDPIFSQQDEGQEMCRIMSEAAVRTGVDVVGSTPYVETSPELQKANIEWMIALARKHSLHLDFHLDYSIDPKIEPMVHHVIYRLKAAHWPRYQAVTLGHCTRLTLLDVGEWDQLHAGIADLPISFVGLPTSDMFMMGRPSESSGGGERVRGTLQIPQMINDYGLQAAIGVNNVGNAFTPQGSCDPLSLAALGVGVYQAATKEDAEILLQCVSTRARVAIGLGTETTLELKEGDSATFVAFGLAEGSQKHGFRHRTSIQELVYDACRERTTVFRGSIVNE